MNARALALGAMIGFVVAIAPSCSPAKCSPQNCADGCCDTVKGTCVKAPSNTNNTSCGSAGNACIDCSASATMCNGATGTCAVSTGTGTGGGAGGGTGTGGGQAACDGCRLPSGTCVPAQTVNEQNCGTGGAICQGCMGTDTCNKTSGTCQAVDAGVASIGSPCNTDQECSAITLTPTDRQLSIVPFCKKTALDVTTADGVGVAYTGGYCSKRCGLEQNSCGTTASARCVFFLGDLGEADNICYKSCNADSDCRSNYFCAPFSATFKACLPATFLASLPDGGFTYKNVDAGPGRVGEAGSACANDATCQPPAQGTCLTETLPDAGMSGFVGGECTAECTASLDDNWCGTGGSCTPLVPGLDDRGPFVRWLCQRGCEGVDGGSDPSLCRNGYVCGNPPNPTCQPKCETSGCGTGGTCNTTTHLCE
jgi:hypothetical protein